MVLFVIEQDLLDGVSDFSACDLSGMLLTDPADKSWESRSRSLLAGGSQQELSQKVEPPLPEAVG